MDITCENDQVLSEDGKSCETVSKQRPTASECEAKQMVLSADGETCIAAPTPTQQSCAALGKVLSEDGKSCVAAPTKPTQESCAALGKVLSQDGESCADAPSKPTALSCAEQGLMLSEDGTKCVPIPLSETALSCAAKKQVVVGAVCADPAAYEYAFTGTFDDVALGFGADTADGLFQACMASTTLWKSATVTSFGSEISDTYKAIKDPWSAEKVCAAAVLNSSAKGDKTVALEAVVDPGLPVTLVSRLVTQIDADLRAYVPKIVVPETQSIFVDGDSYTSYFDQVWTSEDVLSMLRYNTFRNNGNLVAVGKINGAPFLFSGSTEQGIFDQCYDYLDHESPLTSYMTSIFVNGQNRLFAPKATVEKACTAIANDAELL
jgi:hypothetical protein